MIPQRLVYALIAAPSLLGCAVEVSIENPCWSDEHCPSRYYCADEPANHCAGGACTPEIFCGTGFECRLRAPSGGIEVTRPTCEVALCTADKDCPMGFVCQEAGGEGRCLRAGD